MPIGGIGTLGPNAFRSIRYFKVEREAGKMTSDELEKKLEEVQIELKKREKVNILLKPFYAIYFQRAIHCIEDDIEIYNEELKNKSKQLPLFA